MQRYSIIEEKNPREIVLLRGSGCKWRKCRFCDYHLDFSKDEEANFRLNREVLSEVSGRFGALETINSGSFSDLDPRTIEEIARVCGDKGISRLHIECHWRDRENLAAIRAFFAEKKIRVVVKMGVETFHVPFREEVLRKGMDYASPEEIAEYADEVCLLFGLSGQSAESMERDMKTGLRYFDRVCVNVMTENTAAMKPDREVIGTFFERVYPIYKDWRRVDILLENTDFGVGGTANE